MKFSHFLKNKQIDAYDIVTFLKNKQNEDILKEDLFKDVDVIKLDPDRIDAYDIVTSMMPTIIRTAYVNLTEDKKKYEKNFDEEDETFEFSEYALGDAVDDLIEHIRNKFKDISMHDRKIYIDRIKDEFKVPLTDKK